MKFVALLFFISSFCFGQKQIEINFQTENDSTLIQYLKENKIDFSNNQIATLAGIGTFAEYSRDGKLVVPEAYFYNSKGQLIKNRGKGTYCGVEIKKIEKISKMKSDPNQTLQNFLSSINIIEESEFIEDNVDVYIIITWAKFLSTESQTSLSWFSSLKKQNVLNIKFLLLNLDIQESWKLTNDQKKYLGII